LWTDDAREAGGAAIRFLLSNPVDPDRLKLIA